MKEKRTKKKEYSKETLLRIIDWAYTPSLREQWEAFWGMFRALKKQEHWPHMELFNSVSVTLSRQARKWFFSMRTIDAQSEDRYAIPIFLRLQVWKTLGNLMLGRKGHRTHMKESPKCQE